MASNVALVFSKIIDPSNLLYLDDSCMGGPIDWDFGFTPCKNSVTQKDSYRSVDVGKINRLTRLTGSEPKLVGPDDFADRDSNQCDDEKVSNNWDASSDSSLLPYDLVDDDSDLKNHFAQLVDVVKALRKSDDPDGVS